MSSKPDQNEMGDIPEDVAPYNWPFPTYFGKPILKRSPKPVDPMSQFDEAPF